MQKPFFRVLKGKFLISGKPFFCGFVMNQRAFNLFTALVSFVMIMLTVILTNSMTQTEDKAVSTLSDLELQSEIQAVADLARGDALQVFIYNLRYKMESWLTNPNNWFPLESNKDWKQIVNDYIRVNFADVDPTTGTARSQQFAFEVKTQLSAILAIGSSFGRYEVSLKQDDAALLDALNKSISNSIRDPSNQQFFELVGCASEDDCPIGTFYVNLDLRRGAFSSDPQEDARIFESLPKVIIRRIGSNQILETAILPRSKIRIYVPLRIFKTVASAKKNADQAVFGSASNSLRNVLPALKVGFCDSGCDVRREDIRNSSGNSDWQNHACPELPDAPAFPAEKINFQALGMTFSSEYRPEDPTNMVTALNKIVQGVVCDKTNGALSYFNRKENCTGTECRPFDSDVDCVLQGTVTRGLQTKQTYDPPELGTPQPPQNGRPAFCVQMQGLQLRLQYHETDPTYRVSKFVTNPYQIQVNDSGFYNANFDNPPAPNNCYSICDGDPTCRSASNYRCAANR